MPQLKRIEFCEGCLESFLELAAHVLVVLQLGLKDEAPGTVVLPLEDLVDESLPLAFAQLLACEIPADLLHHVAGMDVDGESLLVQWLPGQGTRALHANPFLQCLPLVGVAVLCHHGVHE